MDLLSLDLSSHIWTCWLCLQLFQKSTNAFFTLFQVVPLCLSLNAPSLIWMGSSCPKALQSRTRKGKALRYLCKTSMHQILQNFVFCNTKRVPSEFWKENYCDIVRQFWQYSQNWNLLSIFASLGTPMQCIGKKDFFLTLIRRCFVVNSTAVTRNWTTLFAGQPQSSHKVWFWL